MTADGLVWALMGSYSLESSLLALFLPLERNLCILALRVTELIKSIYGLVFSLVYSKKLK